MQATSKDLRSNLHARASRVLCELGRNIVLREVYLLELSVSALCCHALGNFLFCNNLNAQFGFLSPHSLKFRNVFYTTKFTLKLNNQVEVSYLLGSVIKFFSTFQAEERRVSAGGCCFLKNHAWP